MISRSVLSSVNRAVRLREIEPCAEGAFESKFCVYPDLVARLNLEAELQGHTGCVNCLQWNEAGTLLASGSDDFNIIVWDPFCRRKRALVKTGHSNNIFSVQFIPKSDDRLVVSGAGDFKIRLHDVTREECTHVFGCHLHRVKRLAVSPVEPFLFWSAAEDGLVMQFDLRVQHSCHNVCDHVLLNLNSLIGSHAEAKCISVNPCRPELIAVGCNDPYIRVFDRRMLSLQKVRFADESSNRPWDRFPLVSPVDEAESPFVSGQYYVAGHLPVKSKDLKRRYRPLATTYLTFSPNDNGYIVPGHKNGHNIYSNGLSTANVCFRSSPRSYHVPERTRLSPRAEFLKQRANAYFEKQEFTMAISLYSEACLLEPAAPVLYANRAATYMKRNWYHIDAKTLYRFSDRIV